LLNCCHGAKVRASVTHGALDSLGGGWQLEMPSRTARRKTGQLSTNPLSQQDTPPHHPPARERGIETRIGNHTVRATGMTAYLKNSGLRTGQDLAQMPSHRNLPRKFEKR
jgi:hypothetical protein